MYWKFHTRPFWNSFFKGQVQQINDKNIFKYGLHDTELLKGDIGKFDMEISLTEVDEITFDIQ